MYRHLLGYVSKLNQQATLSGLVAVSVAVSFQGRRTIKCEPFEDSVDCALQRAEGANGTNETKKSWPRITVTCGHSIIMQCGHCQKRDVGCT